MSARVNTAAPTILRFERIGSMLAKIVDNAAVGMVVSEMDGRMVYANRAFVDLLGHRIDETAQNSIFELVHTDDSAAARQQLSRLMRGEAGAYRGEHQFRHADGSPLWVMVAASVLQSDANGQPAYLITQVTSIELQKKAEAALAHSESRWNFALESARQGVWDHDIRTDTMFYSRMWRVMRGIAPNAEVDGDQKKWLARIHPDDLQHVLDNVDRTASQNRSLEREANKYWLLEYLRREKVGTEVGATIVRAEGSLILAEIDGFAERGVVMTRSRMTPGEHVRLRIRDAIPNAGRLVLEPLAEG